ncbi:hypothetical protein DPEC_G00261880 [Dallia pectoralis]|uniref:Uncharacterized protein n=1 Tax=Dallia pectoralis TaxID=75939 RepID=A0ACC2FRP4_DALPE|nr:hypothetical protein DPEC_G00261880 [Dallia pectoralis]
MRMPRCKPVWRFPRPTSCFQRGSLRPSADHRSSDDVYLSCLYAQGNRCILQQRSSGSYRLTGRSSRSQAWGSPVNSPLGGLENHTRRGASPRAMYRPGTAPQEGGEHRGLGHGALDRNRTECPRVPCNGEYKNSSREQKDRWLGRSFSRSSTLHLYLPTTSFCEDKDADLEMERVRPTVESIILPKANENVAISTQSEDLTTKNSSFQEGHRDPIQTRTSRSHPNRQSHSKNIISLWVPSEDMTCATSYRGFQDRTQPRTTGLVATKQRAGDIVREQKSIPLQIMPAAVHKQRGSTSVRQHADRQTKIKTTKTFVWGVSGPQEIKSVSVLQSHIGRYTTN